MSDDPRTRAILHELDRHFEPLSAYQIEMATEWTFLTDRISPVVPASSALRRLRRMATEYPPRVVSVPGKHGVKWRLA